MKTGKIITALMALALVFLNHVANAEPSATLKVGQPAPDFNLPDQNGETRTLGDFRGKWLVLYFYVKDDTPESTEQARGFRDYIPELAALRAQVVGVSVDDSTSHAYFARKYVLPFPLLADSTGETAARYHSLEGDDSPGNPGNLAKRNTFLIDPQGRIAKIYLSASPSRNPVEVIEDLKRANGL
jgi:peroxiredoxin Q/BCP